MLELITADRPGLLSRVGRAFVKCDVQLQNAKIATIGARVDPAAGGVCVRVEPGLQAGARKGRIRLRGKTPTSSDQSGPVNR